MKRYVELLKQEPVLKRLSLIQLIAYFGAWFTNVAIYTLLLQFNVDPTVIAFTAALHFLPGVLQAPFSGMLIDRFEPKRLMALLLVIEIITTALFITVTDISQLWWLYLLLFIRMAASSFYFTLEMSLLPKLLQGKTLQMANEIHSIIWSVSYTLGMALSGFIVYKLGVTVAFMIDALLFVIALVLLSTLTFDVVQKKSESGMGQMILQTFGYIKEHPVVLHLMLLHAAIGFTAYDALVALMADHYYASVIAVSLAIGLLHSFRAIGLVLGPLLLGHMINNKRLLYLLLFQAVAVWCWASVMESFVLSLLASVFVGLGTTTLWSYTYTLLQHHTDEAYYGRIVAYNDMLFLLSAALTSLLIGFLAEAAWELSSITVVLGSGFVAAALYYAWIRKRFVLKEFSS